MPGSGKKPFNKYLLKRFITLVRVAIKIIVTSINENNISSLPANQSLSTSLIVFGILESVKMVFSKNLMKNAYISLLGKMVFRRDIVQQSRMM